MKILAFADVHSSTKALREIKRKSKDADVLVDCGDISIFETNLEKNLRFLNRIKKPVFIIHGNHEEAKTLKEAAKKFDNITFIHKKCIPFQDALFIGYGGGGFSMRDKRLELFALRCKKKKKKYKTIVFVTHAPPYGTKQDLLYKEEHCGSKSARKFVKMIKPKLTICGHIHENFNTIDKIDKTAIVNPGPYGRLIKI